jgi:N-acetylglucosaminyl-diphospho-decaprenol L-rhamnosyltransferase
MTGNRLRVSLAVVVVSYNVRDLLRSCLAATYACLARSPELEAAVWVVDNASTDGSAILAASEFPQARLIESSENLGFAGGNNLALRRLGFDTEGPQPDLVLLLNPDAEPLGDAIGRMAAFLRENPGVGGAGAQLLYPDGSFQHGAFHFPGLWQLWLDFFPPRPRRLLDSRLNGRYPRSLYQAGRPFPIDFALGAALMVRREAITAAGLLDEGYFMYADEVDWCWRMQRAGWSFYCVPAAQVLHHSGGSARQFRSRSFLNLWRSRRRLYARHYGPVRRWAASRIVRMGMRAEERRAQAQARQSGISPQELDQRLEAIRQVKEMFGAVNREA